MKSFFTFILKCIAWVLLLIVLLVGSLFIPGVANLLGLSGFVTDQIESLADDFLNPKLQLGGISYRFPTTAVLTNVTLTQDDTTILTIKKAVISLEELPISSEQVRFSGFELTSPVLRLVVDKQGDIIGWGDLIKDDDDPDDTDDKASDHFAVDVIKMSDATIEYSDQRLKSDAMRIDGFSLEINAKKSVAKDGAAEVPETTRASGLRNPSDPPIPTGPGWYRINTEINRAPIVDITLDMGMNIDSLELVFKHATLNTKMKKDNYHVLPPQVQDFVNKYSVTGDLAARATGYLDIDDPLEGPLLVYLNLNQATIGTDDNQLEIKAFGGQGSLRSDLLLFDQIKGSVLDGYLDADFELRLASQPIPPGTRRSETIAEATASTPPPKTPNTDENVAGPPQPHAVMGTRALSFVAGLQLQKINLQTMTKKRPPAKQLIGLLDLDIEALGVLPRLPLSLHGDGQLRINDARLTNVALVNGLNNAMKVVTRQPQHNDRANVIFDLTPTGVEITHFNLTTSLMAVRGGGVVGFDDSLNLILNGGPLERLQESLGMVGRALGNVTDRLVRYHVTGTTQSPRVAIRPFGLFTGDPMAEAKADREAQRAERKKQREEAAKQNGAATPDAESTPGTNGATAPPSDASP